MLYGLINHLIASHWMHAALRVSYRTRTLLLATIKRFRAAVGIECRFLDSFHRQGFMISTAPEIGRRTHLGFHREIYVVVTAKSDDLSRKIGW